jgi:zinc transport system substrate-binding protein
LGPKPKVAATIFPLYDIVKNVVGEEAEAVLILPPGASPHGFEPRPSQVAELAGAEVVFMIGHGLDDWAGEMALDAGAGELVKMDREIMLLEASHVHDEEGEEEHEEGEVLADPHYWLNVPNALLMSRMVKEVLTQKYPERAEIFEVNQNEYAKRLAKLDGEIRAQLAGVSNKNIVTFHDGWRYFAREYGLTVAEVFEEVAGEEPTAAQVAEFGRRVEAAGVRVIFSEPQLSGELLGGLAGDFGVLVWQLDPLGGVPERDSYEKLMRFNAAQIVQSQ